MTTQAEMKKQIIELYNNSDLKVTEIIQELGISQTQFYRLRKQVISKLNQRPKGKPQKQKRTPKNYTYNHTTGYFEIRKRGIYYGTVKTHQQAVRFVELLNQIGWKKELAGEVKKQVIQELPK